MPSPSAPALYCTNKLYCFTANLSESETLAKMGCRVLRRYKLMLLTSFGGSKTRYDKDRLGGRRKPRPYTRRLLAAVCTSRPRRRLRV